MSTQPNPRKIELPTTYIMQERHLETERSRLIIQDSLITKSMGGVFPEQADPASFQRILDVGCGTGGWGIEAVNTFPRMSLLGIDINKYMVDYANGQAELQSVKDRAEFRVMDAQQPLELPTDSFDLANIRFGSSFLRTWDWPNLLSELVRVTRPGGIIRLTDEEVIHPSNGPEHNRVFETVICALYRSGHLFEQATNGLSAHLAPLLQRYINQQVQTKTYRLEFQAGTSEVQMYIQNMTYGFQRSHPFIEKWGCSASDHEELIQRALKEMRKKNFQVTWPIITIWGTTPS